MVANDALHGISLLEKLPPNDNAKDGKFKKNDTG